jgi:hypothetical protein
MASSVSHRASIMRGLPLLFGFAIAACSGGPAEEPASVDGTVQQQQGFGPHFCGGKGMRDCSSSDVCLPFMARGCAGPTNPGMCFPKPAHCPAASDPVCGCDGKTYMNLCDAAQGGTTVVHDGACNPSPSCDAHTPCPGDGSCTDDRDGHGGLHNPWAFAPWFHHESSSGTCECPATHACASGDKWNSSPKVCACEPTVDPCTGVTCKAGDVCAAGACEPNPCTGISCKAGDVCIVQTDGTGACGVDPCASVSCKSGETCVVLVGGTPECE